MEEIDTTRKEILSVSDWLITLLISAIPLVGFIMLFVWAFSSNVPASKSNWPKATLVLMVIGIVLAIIILVIFGATILGLYDSGITNPNEY